MFVLWILSFMRSLNDNLLSRVSPRYYWFELSLISEFLKKSGECAVAFFLLEKIVSCVCLVQSGLNDISFGMPNIVFLIDHYWVLKLKCTRFTTLNKEESSENSLTSEFSPCGRSFIQMRKKGILVLILASCRLLLIADWKIDHTKWLFDVHYGWMTQLVKEHSRLLDSF